MVIFDEDWRYQYVNAAACTMLGRTRDELLGQRALRDSWASYRTLRLASGALMIIVRDADAHFMDNRARQFAEQERSRLARVLEQAPFAVAVTTGPDHILQSANQRQMRLFGYRPTLNMSTRDAFPEPELAPVHATFDRAYNENTTIVMREQRIGWDRTGSGEIEYGYFDLIYQPITDENGCVEGLLCVSTEVTESVEARLEVTRAREQAESALAAAEAARDRLDQIMAAIPTAIAVTRGCEHVYDLTNATHVSMIGGRNVLGLRLIDAYPEVQENGFLALLDHVYRDGVSTELPERRVVYDKHSNGTEYEGYFSSFFAPLRARTGEVTGVVVSALEVTEQVLQRQHNDVLRGAVERAHAQLELRIAERTAELAQSNSALAAEISARNDLQRRLHSAREDEQRRTARDLHDQVGQTLSALTLTIKAAVEADTLPTTTLSRLQEALRLADILGRDIHDIATRLRPAVLDAFGLHAALRQLITSWSHHCGVVADYEAAWLKHKRLPTDTETALYRITQEALTNVARHASATHVSVVVELQAGNVIVVIEDNGRGFEVAVRDSGRMGLESMRERVMLVGGTFDIESYPGAGTTVFVSIPLVVGERHN